MFYLIQLGHGLDTWVNMRGPAAIDWEVFDEEYLGKIRQYTHNDDSSLELIPKSKEFEDNNKKSRVGRSSISYNR